VIAKTLTLLLSILVVTACSTATPSPVPNSAPTIAPAQEQVATLVVALTPTQTAPRLPVTEADVPRVTVDNAKAALDAGIAVIVDVRSKEAYDASHIAGALFIPLSDMENNPEKFGLDKDQWIITYCT
jgi:hypothetical protein